MQALGALLYKEGFLDIRAQRIAQEYEIPLLTLEEGLNNKEYQGIAIATPPATHFDIAHICIAHKKHVFVEKPLVKNVQQNKQLIEEAAAQNIVLMVGHLLRYHPAYEALLDRLPDIGPVLFAIARRMNWGKIYKNDNIIWDYLPHDLSMILPIFSGAPQSVRAHPLHFVRPNLADTCTVDLTFGDNQHAHIFLSRINPYKEQKLTVIGKKGSMIFDDTKPWKEKLTFFDNAFPHARDPEVLPPPKGHAIILTPSEPLKLELKHFLQCMQDQTMPRTGGQDALDILSVIAVLEHRT